MITPTNQQAKTATKATRRPRGARSLPTLEACTAHPPDRRSSLSYQSGSQQTTPITGWYGARVKLSIEHSGEESYGVQASGQDGADGLRAVPRDHDVRAGAGRGGLEGDHRPLPRSRRQL